MGRAPRRRLSKVAAYLYGPLTRFGLIAAVIACAIDQASKLWLLFVFDLANKGLVRLTPFLDLVLTWNIGISYGLFPQESDFGRYVLLALKFTAVIVLWVWLARAETRLTALSLGLIIGGALGNAIDRLAYGAVADFVLFHITRRRSISPGTCLTLPMPPSLPEWSDSCMSPSSGDHAAKAP